MTFVTNSSNVMGYEYEPGAEELTIEFKGGVRYLYQEVSHEVFEDMLEAESIGAFVGTHIRGKFPTTKLEKE